MPLYEYHCPACNRTFEKLRPIALALQPAPCPAGHAEAQRTLSLFSTGARRGEPEQAAGGCCGGSCGCGRQN